MEFLTLDQAKNAIENKTCIDFHYKDDEPKTWRWMVIMSLSDDETCIYYKPKGCGLTYLCASLDNIIVDKIG